MDILKFERLPVPEFKRWKEDSSLRMNRHWEKVSAEAENVRSLTLLIKPYSDYLPTAEGMEISAFYVASNELHGIAGRKSLPLPVKPLIAGYCIGEYGRSGVVSVKGVGTRFAAAVISSDEEADNGYIWDENRPLAKECESCSACVEACPNGALMGDGRLDVSLCLRAQAQFQQPRMPDSSRGLIGSSVWGCEICQRVCPRNLGLEKVKMPGELEAALELKKLIAGDVSGLGKWIGTNYARPARMQARACIIAANMDRRDLEADIRALLNSPVEAVRDCAEWAINKLRNGGK